MKFLDIVLNVPLDMSFSYRDIPAGKTTAQEEEAQQDLIPQKKLRKKETFEPEVGKRAEVLFGNRRMTGIITGIHDTLPKSCPVEEGKIRPVLRILDEKPILTKELISLGWWMKDYYLCTIGEALSVMIPSGKRETDAGGFSMIEESTVYKEKPLSDEQEKAVNEITSFSDDSQKTQVHYIYGKTGSGKTEVFLRAAENVLKKGCGVIYLVPEIGLTPQVTEAVVERFGKTAAILHSGLTASQKLSEWKRILSKEARVVIGARSAVFAPVPDLGMIIIDEEHDGSYKSGNTPRYHARQIAMLRAARLKIPLVMGSATPSVEAWHSIKTGLFKCHYLTKRLAGGKMPLIQCINLSNEADKSQCISEALTEEIRNTLQEKKQTILFLNRRGFNHFFRCSYCGFEIKCKNCSVPLTYHKATNRLVCHYCGYSMLPPPSCPECGSMDIGYSGFGTEYIEAEVNAKFPAARTIRIDTDSLTKKGELEEKIKAFKSGGYDIMLGTQMIAKGLNFPNLKLVGVILADTSLHLPDFRAAEKTFSLITQVAGRAGRFFPDGKVFVQTYSPENPAVYFACHNLTEKFYSGELEMRKLLNFPPFARLIRLVFRSSFEKSAKKSAEDGFAILSAELEQMKARHLQGADTTEILGPSECPLSKISGNFREQILLRGSSIAVLQKLSAHLLFDFKHQQDIYIEADVDPVSLL